MTDYDLTVTAKLQLISATLGDIGEEMAKGAQVTQDDVYSMSTIANKLNFIADTHRTPVFVTVAEAMQDELMKKGVIRHG